MATILIEKAADAALATHWPPGADVLEEERHRQMQLTLRLIVNGSDPLVLAVYHRLCMDHTWPKTVNAKDASSWSDLATGDTVKACWTERKCASCEGSR